jgi:serine/threonine-protein kinase
MSDPTRRQPDAAALPQPLDPAGELLRRWAEWGAADVAAFLEEVGPLSPAALAAVLRVDQRQRWQAGERVPAEHYLQRHPALAADPEAALDLIFNELLLRERLGERPDPGEYLARFPEHAATLRQQIDLHRAVAGGSSAPTLPPHGPGQKPAAGAEGGALPSVPGYEVFEELGRGGMGVVYKARQVKAGRTVALKMILAGAHAGAAERSRFQTEAEAVARLSHPNIVQIYEVGEHDGKPFFSLELCPGGSLDKKLGGDPQQPRQAAGLVEVLARAMHAAHQHQVIHRDLKPANVLLAEDGTPKITDFGLAKKLDEAGRTASGAVLGTASYMAPEQAEGKREVGPAADVYALGAILYECLTGRPPFKAASALDTVLQVLADEPVPPAQLNGKVPPDLETICLKCLHKEPQRRYASAEALAADLERYLAGESIQARSVNLMGRIALALERSQHDIQFRAYGNMLFGFAAIALLSEVAVTWIIHTRQPVLLLFLTQWARVLFFGLMFWRYRPTELVPSNAAGRLMWSTWIGYLWSCVVLGVSYRVVAGWAVELDVNVYPGFAALAGLAFFVMGSNYWGWCYAFGLAFSGLPFLMTVDLRWAPIEFGALWAVALTVIGLRLLRLGSSQQRKEKAQNLA